MSTTPVTPTAASRAAAPAPPVEHSGWAMFAGIVLALNGCFAIMYGLAAILNDEVVTVGGHGVVMWDFTTWGWISLSIGVVMTLTAIGLATGNGAARWLGITFAFLNALSQFGTASAFPLWSLIAIALDVVVIYQLMTHWNPDAL